MEINIPGKYNTPFQVLKTDYTNFSIVYSCKHYMGVGRSEYLWIFMRDQFAEGERGWDSIKNKVINELEDIFDSNTFEDKNYKEYSKFLDFNNYLSAQTQGSQNCNYGVNL